MTDIRTADFCDQYGYTQAQITYAIKTGKLTPIKRGVIDEELSLQAEPYRVCRRPIFLRECPDEKTKIYS